LQALGKRDIAAQSSKREKERPDSLFDALGIMVEYRHLHPQSRRYFP